MSWSKAQQVRLFRASAAAGWTEQQRYMAMRYAGCPSRKGGRPSAKAPGNSQRHFELVMALAERSARARGAHVEPPRGARSWDDLVGDDAYFARQRRLARSIEAELIDRVPEVFAPGFLAGFIRRMTRSDDARRAGLLVGELADRLDECDGVQLFNVIEGLKAWGGRELLMRGLRPHGFEAPASVIRQVSALQREGRAA